MYVTPLEYAAMMDKCVLSRVLWMILIVDIMFINV